jgi:hypothetical protein
MNVDFIGLSPPKAARTSHRTQRIRGTRTIVHFIGRRRKNYDNIGALPSIARNAGAVVASAANQRFGKCDQPFPFMT